MKKRKIIAVILLILIAIFLYVLAEGPIAAFLIGFVVLYTITFVGMIVYSANKLNVSLASQQNDGGGGGGQIQVHIENTGRLPVMSCLITAQAENLITKNKEQCRWSLCIGPKKTKTISFDVRDTLCGGILVEVDHVGVGDFTRLMEKNVTVKKQVYTYILPGLQELSVLKEDIGRYDMESHKFSPYKKGNDSGETFGISEYQPGDNMKYIHWKLSGKMDALVVRELGLPIDNKLMLLVEKSVQEFDGERNSKATELAASLSYTFARASIPHAFGWFNSRKGQFENFKIASEADLWNCLPNLLISPYEEKQNPVIEKFIEAETEKDFSRFVVVANQEIDIERLRHYGEVDLYTPEDFRQS